MINKKALRNSIIFSIIEVTIFLIICSLGSFDQNKNFSWNLLISKIIPNLTNMFIAIATTWYVIFTYYILESYEYSRKELAEPFISIKWMNSSKKSQYIFNKHDEFSKQFLNDLGITPKEVDQENRYVNLKLQNLRSKKLGRVFVEISAQVKIKDKLWGSSNLSWDCDEFDLGREESKEVTVNDLKAIPKSAQITFKLLNISYCASDSKTPIIRYQGFVEYTSCGIAEFEEVEPKPQLDTAGKRG